VVLVEPFRVHVADEVLDDLRTRLRHTRWPDQIPDIGWEQGTELDWLQRLVSFWADEFDWRAWERKLNALDHFTWGAMSSFMKRKHPHGSRLGRPTSSDLPRNTHCKHRLSPARDSYLLRQQSCDPA